MATGEVLEDVTPRETLEAALEADRLRRLPRGARRRPGTRRPSSGSGSARVVESTTYGSAFYKAAGHPRLGPRGGLGPDRAYGRGQCLGRPHGSGQGYETAFAQVRGRGPRRRRRRRSRSHLGQHRHRALRHGQPRRARWHRRRRRALPGARSRARQGARHRGAPARADLRRVPAPARGRGRATARRRLWTRSGLALAELARAAYLDPLACPTGWSPGSSSTRAYDPPPMTYSNATHAVRRRARSARPARVQIAALSGRRGLRHRAQPAARRGPAARRDRDGYRRRPARERRVTTGDGQILSRQPCRLPAADAQSRYRRSSSMPHAHSQPAHAGRIKGMAEGGVMGAIGAVDNAVNDALAPFGVAASASRSARPPARPAARRAGQLAWLTVKAPDGQGADDGDDDPGRGYRLARLLHCRMRLAVGS